MLYHRAPSQVPPVGGPFSPGHRGYVWSLEGLDANTLASGGRDATIHIWNSQGQALRQLRGHSQSVLGLAALPHRRLASVSRDRSLRIWNWQTGACEQVVQHAHGAAVLCVMALPGGGLATGGADGQVHIWQDDGIRTASLPGSAGWIWNMATLPDGVLACACEDGGLHIWNIATATPAQTLSGSAPLRSVAASADGQQLVSANILGDVTLWARAGATWAATRTWRAHDAAVRSVRYLDPQTLASAGEDGALHVWSLASGALLHSVHHGNFVTDVLAVGNSILSCSYDGQIHAMDDLQPQWAQTWSALGLGDPRNARPAELFRQLNQRYTEPHRRYHTLQHLRECLALCARDQALAQRPAEVAMALWFHDAIYTHGRTDNEQASADWAQDTLLQAGAEPAVADRVHALVMATRHSEAPTTTDAQFLVDIDLAILGATAQRFDEYTTQIQEEYSHVPPVLFRTKRREVLESFLLRPQIFRTAAYRQRYEAPARDNLRRALSAAP